jgi:hypothetical protein
MGVRDFETMRARHDFGDADRRINSQGSFSPEGRRGEALRVRNLGYGVKRRGTTYLENPREKVEDKREKIVISGAVDRGMQVIL